MGKSILVTASIFGATAVILGAFGAHALKGAVDPGSLDIWAKAVEYQFYHTAALMFLYLISATSETKLVNVTYWFFTLGILLFSGSLYLLATRTISGVGFANLLGPITPIGGLFFILGWLSLLILALKKNNA